MEWLSSPVFFPGEFHGQRSLAGYNPGGCKKSDTTEQLTLTDTIYWWLQSINIMFDLDLFDAERLPVVHFKV